MAQRNGPEMADRQALIENGLWLGPASRAEWVP
jgi:hypothetical protein